MTVHSEAILIDFGSVMQLSRHKPQPLHSASFILGLTMSSFSAPSTGQLPIQAPHSGPLYGRQSPVSMLALASFGTGISGRLISLLCSSLQSFSSPGFACSSRALGIQAETQGQSSHKWQPLLSKSRAGVPANFMPNRADKLNITSCGQASTQSLQRVHANIKSSSLMAKGGRIQCKACFLMMTSAALITGLLPLSSADLKNARLSIVYVI